MVSRRPGDRRRSRRLSVPAGAAWRIRHVDDNRNFLETTAWRGLGLTELRWMWTTTHMGHYIPITWMSLGLDYVLWGMNPAGYHVVNVALHAINAALVYFLARRLLSVAGVTSPDDPRGAGMASVLAALVFAVHPLRVESVAWITERRDMLSLLWCLEAFSATCATRPTSAWPFDGTSRRSRCSWRPCSRRPRR